MLKLLVHNFYYSYEHTTGHSQYFINILRNILPLPKRCHYFKLYLNNILHL